MWLGGYHGSEKLSGLRSITQRRNWWRCFCGENKSETKDFIYQHTHNMAYEHTVQSVALC